MDSNRSIVLLVLLFAVSCSGVAGQSSDKSVQHGKQSVPNKTQSINFTSLGGGCSSLDTLGVEYESPVLCIFRIKALLKDGKDYQLMLSCDAANATCLKLKYMHDYHLEVVPSKDYEECGKVGKVTNNGVPVFMRCVRVPGRPYEGVYVLAEAPEQ